MPPRQSLHSIVDIILTSSRWTCLSLCFYTSNFMLRKLCFEWYLINIFRAAREAGVRRALKYAPLSNIFTGQVCSASMKPFFLLILIKLCKCIQKCLIAFIIYSSVLHSIFCELNIFLRFHPQQNMYRFWGLFIYIHLSMFYNLVPLFI